MATHNIHAGCVVLGDAGTAFGAPADAGVLFIGPSGCGKSDLMLRLIAAGAMLVSDDRTDLSIEDGVLTASPPAAIAGLIEIRGLGILALPYRHSARVALAVELAPQFTPARMPQHASYTPPADLILAANTRPPLIRLNPFEFSAPAKIAAAVAGFAHALFREAIESN